MREEKGKYIGKIKNERKKERKKEKEKEKEKETKDWKELKGIEVCLFDCFYGI